MFATSPTLVTPNIGAATATQVNITGQGDLRLEDTTGGEYIALQAPGTLASSYTLTMPVDDGTPGQALVTDGSGNLSWSTTASGDVYGPASATDNAIARFDLVTGKLIQNSVVTIGDAGELAGVKTLTASDAITGATLRSSNGIFTNANTITANQTIAATDNAGSYGPMSINSGVVVTVSSGAVWTII